MLITLDDVLFTEITLSSTCFVQSTCYSVIEDLTSLEPRDLHPTAILPRYRLPMISTGGVLKSCVQQQDLRSDLAETLPILHL